MSETTARRLARMAFGAIILMYVLGFGLSARDIPNGFGGDVAFAVLTFSFPLVGILILSRQPRNAIGWILVSIGFFWGLSIVLGSYVGFALAQGHRHAAALADAVDSPLWVPPIGIMGTFLILLFPDGRLPSPRWRALGWLSGLAMLAAMGTILLAPGPIDNTTTMANPLGITGLKPLLGVLQVSLVLIPACIVASAVSLIRRFRRSRGVERMQLKWLTAAAAVVAGLYAVAMAVSVGTSWGQADTPLFAQIAQDLALFSFALIPAAIGIAILRHRLFDIDVVINKTLVYGLLAAFITAVYVAIVAGAGAILGSGGKPNLALSVSATAIVAVAFHPVRERVQRLANRVVYGHRATPYEVLSRFSETIATFFGAEELLPHTAETLREATGASRSCVWLKSDHRLVPAAMAPAEGPELATRALTSEVLPPLPGDGAAPIFHQGELLGALTIAKPAGDTVTPADRELLDNLASQAGQVLRNARLTADLQARLDQLAAQAREIQRSRQRIVAAQDDERRALERNIHDGAQQHLVALAVKLKLAKTLAARAPDKASMMLGQLRTEVGDTLTALRELASGIYPAVLEAEGVAAALETQTRHSPVATTIAAQNLGRYPLESEATVYFCCLEALQNVAKYAGAGHASVTLWHDGGALKFRVEDDGAGFDPATTPKGSGLQNMVDRIEALGGSLDVTSAVGRGTTVAGQVPIGVPEAVR